MFGTVTVSTADKADCVLWFGKIDGTLQGSGEKYVEVDSGDFEQMGELELWRVADVEVTPPQGGWDVSPMAPPPETGRTADHGFGVNGTKLNMINLYCESAIKTVVNP